MGKPELGIIEFDSSRKSNIVVREPHRKGSTGFVSDETMEESDETMEESDGTMEESDKAKAGSAGASPSLSSAGASPSQETSNAQ